MLLRINKLTRLLFLIIPFTFLQNVNAQDIEYISIKAEGGDTNSQYVLGMRYYEGEDLKKDFR